MRRDARRVVAGFLFEGVPGGGVPRRRPGQPAAPFVAGERRVQGDARGDPIFNKVAPARRRGEGRARLDLPPRVLPAAAAAAGSAGAAAAAAGRRGPEGRADAGRVRGPAAALAGVRVHGPARGPGRGPQRRPRHPGRVGRRPGEAALPGSGRGLPAGLADQGVERVNGLRRGAGGSPGRAHGRRDHERPELAHGRVPRHRAREAPAAQGGRGVTIGQAH